MNVKFGVYKYNRHKPHDKNGKFRKFKMADGRHLKIFYPYILAADHLILMKFGVPMHILVSRMVTWQKKIKIV